MELRREYVHTTVRKALDIYEERGTACEISKHTSPLAFSRPSEVSIIEDFGRNENSALA